MGSSLSRSKLWRKELSTKSRKLDLRSAPVESAQVTLEELQARQSKLVDIVGKIQTNVARFQESEDEPSDTEKAPAPEFSTVQLESKEAH